MSTIFSTINAIIPASDWVVVYAREDPPFYYVLHVACIVAGREKIFSQKTRTWQENMDDTLAFMDVDADGIFNDPTEISNFLAFSHERDIDDARKAYWSQLGQEYREKSQKKSAAKE